MRLANQTYFLDEFRDSRQPVAFAICSSLLAIFIAFLTSAGFGAPLVGIALISLASVLTIRTDWVAAVGLLPVLLVPIGGMETTTFGPIPIALPLALFTAGYGFVALIANNASNSLTIRAAAPLVVIGVAGLAQQGFTFESVSSSFLMLLVWSGALVLGCAATTRPDSWRPVAYVMIGLAAIALIEPIIQEPVWNRVAGNMLFGSNDTFIRSRSTFGQPLVAGVLFSAMAVWFWSRRGRLAIFATTLCAMAAAMTASRSAAIVFVVGALLVLIRGDIPVSRTRASGGILGTIALVVALFIAVPSISESLSQRMSAETDDARAATFALLVNRLNDDPVSLLVGTGFRSTGEEIRRSGGNFGVNSFDNQYMTLAYEIGLIALLGTLALILHGLANSSMTQRVRTLPAFAGIAVSLIAFDGLYWFSVAAVFWFFYGELAGDPGAEPREGCEDSTANDARGAA